MKNKHTILFYQSSIDTQKLEKALANQGYELIKGRFYAEIANRFDSEDVYCAMALLEDDNNRAVEFLRSIMQANWMIQRVGLIAESTHVNILSAVNHAHVDYLWQHPLTESDLQKLLSKVGRRHDKLIRPLAKFDMLSEVTENLLNQNEKFRKEAKLDGLTGLFNRRSFNSISRRFWERHKKVAAGFSLAILDLDHFKRVNDTYGHQTGDEVLRQIANILNSHQRMGIDFAFRYGGEEFAILSVGTNLAEMKMYLMRLIEIVRVKKIDIMDDRQISVTFSSGICASGDAGSFEELLGKADAALYHAKKNGRNQIVVYDKENIHFDKSQINDKA